MNKNNASPINGYHPQQNIYSQIHALREIKEQQQQLAEKEAALLAPTLTDLNRLPEIYQWFREIEPECRKKSNTAISVKKKFILLSLFLYSPRTFTGKKMIAGLREKLAEVLHVASRSSLSDDCSEIVFIYQHYKDFRLEADELHRWMQQKINGLDHPEELLSPATPERQNDNEKIVGNERQKIEFCI